MGANYGSGSRQQISTTTSKKDDANTLWTVRDAERLDRTCRTGEPILCGDKIRLEHSQTNKNLHSHSNFRAVLSNRQEVSCFGDDGMGDQGDDWEVVCNVDTNYGPVKGQGQKVLGKDLFQLRHIDTGNVLTSEKNFRFTQQNCPRCVIVGDMETSCIPP